MMEANLRPVINRPEFDLEFVVMPKDNNGWGDSDNEFWKAAALAGECCLALGAGLALGVLLIMGLT